MRRLPRLVLLGFPLAVLVCGCPGNRPQLDPKYDVGGGGQVACGPPRIGVCMRASDGVHCALSDEGSLGPMTSWAPALDDANGWALAKHFDTIHFPDVNGDGADDVCGRAADGIRCGLNRGTSFEELSAWSPSFVDGDGFDGEAYYSTIAFVDVDGDGMADVCGRAATGIRCGLSNGSAFDGVTLWSAQLSDANDWTDPSAYKTIQYPDVNGDGRADLCARAHGGIVCALSTSVTFAGVEFWSTAFTTDAGWSVEERYSTIRFPDVNGDGFADVCGRGAEGIVCGLSTGTQFEPASLWSPQLSDANGWLDPSAYLTIAYPDVDGDGRVDLCARSHDGVICALNTGTNFGPTTLWAPQLNDGVGWGDPALYAGIRYVDLDGDGRSDICGRNTAGILCGVSDVVGAFAVTEWTSDFSDAQGFGATSSIATLATPRLLPERPCP